MYLYLVQQPGCCRGREAGWHIYYLPTTIEGLQYWPMSRSHGGTDYTETYTHIYNEVTARGSPSTDVPSEEVMTSSPGIPLPAVLWHHQDQEVCVICESCATAEPFFFFLTVVITLSLFVPPHSSKNFSYALQYFCCLPDAFTCVEWQGFKLDYYRPAKCQGSDTVSNSH